MLALTVFFSVGPSACSDDDGKDTSSPAAHTTGSGGATSSSSGGDSGGAGGATSAAATSASSTSTGTAGATCEKGDQTPPGRLCVRGAPNDTGESLTVGGPL